MVFIPICHLHQNNASEPCFLTPFAKIYWHSSRGLRQLNMMYNPDSVLDLGFGLGSMDNENAIAVGLGGVLPDSNMRYSLSATYSDYTAQVSYGAGLSFSLE